ncbi:hypothetical protein Tco_0645568 [Tanacetum coccineum]
MKWNLVSSPFALSSNVFCSHLCQHHVPSAATATIVSIVYQAKDHGFGGLGGFSALAALSLFDDEAWTPCVKRLRPVYLLAFRIIPSCLLLALQLLMLLLTGGTPLRVGITPLKNDVDVDDFVNLGYKNKWVVDLYVKHNGYDALDIRDQSLTIVHDEGNDSNDAYCSSDDEELGLVDFYTESDDNVVIKTLTTNDHFLNKLCSNNGHFRGFIDEHVNAYEERVVEDT